MAHNFVEQVSGTVRCSQCGKTEEFLSDPSRLIKGRFPGCLGAPIDTTTAGNIIFACDFIQLFWTNIFPAMNSVPTRAIVTGNPWTLHVGTAHISRLTIPAQTAVAPAGIVVSSASVVILMLIVNRVGLKSPKVSEAVGNRKHQPSWYSRSYHDCENAIVIRSGVSICGKCTWRVPPIQGHAEDFYL